MDEMSVFELNALLSAYNDNEKVKWDQIRKICQFIYHSNPNVVKAKPLQQIIPFTWDKIEEKEKLTEYDKNRLSNKALKISDMLNKWANNLI